MYIYIFKLYIEYDWSLSHCHLKKNNLCIQYFWWKNWIEPNQFHYINISLKSVNCLLWIFRIIFAYMYLLLNINRMFGFGFVLTICMWFGILHVYITFILHVTYLWIDLNGYFCLLLVLLLVCPGLCIVLIFFIW